MLDTVKNFLLTGVFVVLISLIFELLMKANRKRRQELYKTKLKEIKIEYISGDIFKKTNNKLVLGTEEFIVDFSQEPNIYSFIKSTSFFSDILFHNTKVTNVNFYNEEFFKYLQDLFVKVFIEVKEELNNSGKELYNEKQVAIQYMSHHEKNKTINIHLYHTDYFTCRFLRKISYNLRNSKYITDDNRIEVLFTRLSFLFVNALSVNSLVLFSEHRYYDSFLLGTRSVKLDMNPGIKQLALSETINDSDFKHLFRSSMDNESLKNVVFRGLSEELGIEKALVHSIDIGSIYVVKSNFNIGIDSLIKLKAFDSNKIPINFNYIYRNSVDSLDFNYEYSSLEKNHFTKRHIIKLIEKNYYFLPIVIKYYVLERNGMYKSFLNALLQNPFKK